jgi:type VI secretion-associated protein, ImpA family
MSDELQQPSVIDLDVLLAPISEENPSGESLRYSGIYDEISEARRADDNLAQGDWQSELKIADFRKVVDLAVPALSTKTKDLQIGAWLTEALIKQHGFIGLRDGLKVLAGFQDKFWETVYPEIDEGDMEGRGNALSWLDTQAALAVKGAPFTGVSGYGFWDWEDSKKYDFPDDAGSLSTEEQAKVSRLKVEAEKERRVTAELWRKEIAATRRASCETVNYTIDECWTAFADLNRVIEEKFDRNQAPGLTNLKKALDEVHTQAKKLLDEKRIEEPDAVEEVEAPAGAEGNIVAGAAAVGGGGAIQSRKDALKRLAEIATFFQKTEPHSPVSYLVQRAVKWGNMPLENWLQEVIKDQSVLVQLKETLGFGSSNGESPGGTG